MGEFKAGEWILYLIIYFIVLTLLTQWALNFGNDYSLVNTGEIKATGGGLFLANTGNVSNLTNQDISASSSIKPANIIDTIGFLSGFSDSFNLGMPDVVKLIANIILFWIPAFMFLFAVYMILPFFH